MTSIDPAVPQDETHPHRELINGLLQLVGFLTDHPELPVNRYDGVDLAISIRRHQELSDSDRIAALRQIAAMLDVEPHWSGDSHLYANRQFGPRVQIQACVIRQAAMEEHCQIQELGKEALHEQRAIEAAAAALAAVAEGQGDEDGGGLAEVECADCRGTGRQRDDSPCADCLGKGRVLPRSEDEVTPEAALAETAAFPPPDRACAVCEGSGQGADEFGICDGTACEHCHGSGVRPPVGAAW